MNLTPHPPRLRFSVFAPSKRNEKAGQKNQDDPLGRAVLAMVVGGKIPRHKVIFIPPQSLRFSFFHSLRGGVSMSCVYVMAFVTLAGSATKKKTRIEDVKMVSGRCVGQKNVLTTAMNKKCACN